MKDQSRNLNPHAEALLYSWIFGKEYARQGGGVMNFWDRATKSEKKHMQENIDRLLKTRRSTKIVSQN